MTRRRWIADTSNGNTASLTGDQAAHLARVLRAEPGQIFDVVANGFLHRAEISTVSDHEVVFTLHEELEAEAALPVHLLLAVFKFDHLEWGIEKATELGAARITPVLARRTEKHLAQAAAKRVERWRRIAREASQQSRRSDVPDIDDPAAAEGRAHLVDAPHETPARRNRTGQHARRRAAASTTGFDGPDAEHNRASSPLAIGPEGGWTAEEMQLFTAQRLAARHARPRILRAETAAICRALHLLRIL